MLPSLFEEEILHEEIELTRALEAGAEHFAEALDYFPAIDRLRRRRRRATSPTSRRSRRGRRCPVIASLNATTTGGWVRYARCSRRPAPTRSSSTSTTSPPTRAHRRRRRRPPTSTLVAAVRGDDHVPLAVKLSPYYSAMANFARRVVAEGADGLVLFNRFYQPDLDLETARRRARVELSQPWELRLPLRWIAILRPQLGPDVSLAATSGITRAPTWSRRSWWAPTWP